MEYTAAEYVDMLIMYGQCGENALRAAREYNIHFLERRPIVYGVILRLLYRARETTNLIPNRRIMGARRALRQYLTVLRTCYDFVQFGERFVFRRSYANVVKKVSKVTRRA